MAQELLALQPHTADKLADQCCLGGHAESHTGTTHVLKQAGDLDLNHGLMFERQVWMMPPSIHSTSKVLGMGPGGFAIAVDNALQPSKLTLKLPLSEDNMNTHSLLVARQKLLLDLGVYRHCILSSYHCELRT